MLGTIIRNTFVSCLAVGVPCTVDVDSLVTCASDSPGSPDGNCVVSLKRVKLPATNGYVSNDSPLASNDAFPFVSKVTHTHNSRMFATTRLALNEEIGILRSGAVLVAL